MPRLPSFVIFFYSQHVHHYYSNKSVTSHSWVQQGRLSSLLFSLTLRPIVEEIDSKLTNATHHCCYIDDGIIAGTETELNEVIDTLTVSVETCGLELRRENCEVWSKGPLNTTDSKITRKSRDGLEMLGVAVGSPRFLASSIQKRVHDIEKLLENLEYIDDPQCALGILSSCLDALKMGVEPFRGSRKNFWSLTRFKGQLSRIYWVVLSN